MTGLTIDLPPETIEQIAARAAELVAARKRDGEPDAWLSVAGAAEYLACSSSRLYGLVSARRIPFEKDGSRVLFRRSALDQWVTEGGARCP
jgi:excisionase family DNA binding protein